MIFSENRYTLFRIMLQPGLPNVQPAEGFRPSFIERGGFVQRTTSSIEIARIEIQCCRRSVALAQNTFLGTAGAPQKYLFALGPCARDALLRPDDSAGGHFRSRYFLHLPGGTCAVIDLDALPETQLQNVLLVGELLRSRRVDYSEHSACSKDQHADSLQQRA